MTEEQSLKAAWLAADRDAVEAMEQYMVLRSAEQAAWTEWRAVLLELRKTEPTQ